MIQKSINPKIHRGKLLKTLLLVIYITLPAYGQHLSRDFVEMSTKDTKVGLDVLLQNNAYFDVTVTIDMQLTNIEASAALPYTTVLRGKETQKVFELKVINPKKEARYETEFNYRIGNKNAVHDTSFIYQLPYKTGTSHKVVQGYFGNYSHDETSLHAIDFKMPVNTPVYATRDGVVVGLYEDSNQGGPNDKYLYDSNYIFIRHDDLTIGVYHHLKKGGVVVRIGQVVRRGEFIGYSGNTGFSFAPHLHFEVMKAANGYQYESFPIKFKTRQGIIRNPIEGKIYTAD